MGLLTRLFHLPLPSPPDDPALPRALERTAARIDVNLKRSRHWPGRYRDAIAGALAQARRVAQGIPGPVTLDRESWIKDPFTHALFASSAEMERIINASLTVRNFLARHGGSEIHALLSLRREVKQGFGMEASGAVLRRDVAQSVAWFSDPHFIDPAGSEADARENLLWALFDRFLDRLAVGIERIHAEQQRQVRAKDVTQARLRGAQSEQRSGLESELNVTLKRLGDISECLDPERAYEVFNTVLSHPEDCLYLERHTLHLDALGVVQASAAAPGVATLDFVDLLERYQAPRCVVLVNCRNVTPSTMTQRLGEAGNWL
jgi:hypothetical protein